MTHANTYSFRAAAAGHAAVTLGAGRYVRAGDTTTIRRGECVVAEPPASRVTANVPKSRRWSLLHNTGAEDAHACRVGKNGPSCYIVQNAVRVLGDVSLVARELEISLSGVAQALNYAAEFLYRPSTEDAEMFQHAAAMLFADED